MELWQGLLGIFITGLFSYAAARYAGKSSVKVKELDVDGQAYLRAEGITANLIKQLTEQVTDLTSRLEKVENEVSEVKDHNNALISFAYILIALARKYGYQDEIPSPAPKGIHL